MSTTQPVPTAQHAAAAAGVHLPPSAQHVLDSLESHLAAVLEHAKTASPGATRVIVGFANDVLDKLEEWGVELRGTLEAYRAKVDEVSGFNAEANTNTVATSSGVGSSASASTTAVPGSGGAQGAGAPAPNGGVQGAGATNPTGTEAKPGTVGSGIGSGG